MLMRERQTGYEAVISELEDARKRDYAFSGGSILGSMCTQPHPVAVEAYNRFMETNLGDPLLFPGARSLEEKTLGMICGMLNAPAGAGGQFVSGGTESNIMAMALASRLTGRDEIIIPASAHFSFEKAASLMRLKAVSAPTTDGFLADVSAVRELANERTACIVGVAGTTELGMIDPIAGLAKVAGDNGCMMHVDAAFGGFVIPFMKQMGYEMPDFDFSVPGVTSVSIDPHKMGCSTIPAGVIAVGEGGNLCSIGVDTPYVSTKTQPGLLSTRPGAAAAATYAVMRHLGNAGYRQIVEGCLSNTRYLCERLSEEGFSLPCEPQMNVVGIRFKKPRVVKDALAERKFFVAPLDRVGCIRVVCMPHVKREHLDSFIPVLKTVARGLGEI